MGRSRPGVISVWPPQRVTPSSPQAVLTSAAMVFGQPGCRSPFRKEHDHKEPQRACAKDGNVVGVDVNSVTPDEIGGKGDRVCRDNKKAVAYVDDRRVLAN